MLKILHISESIEGGGAETVFRETVDNLKNTDFKNEHLIICRKPLLYDSKIEFYFEESTNYSILKKIDKIFSINNYKILKSVLFKIKPDIIHIHNIGNLSPSIFKAIFEYKKKENILKVIHSVHTFEYICSHYAAFDYKKNNKCLDCVDHRFKFKIFYRGCSRLGYFHSFGKGISSLIYSYYTRKKIVDLWTTPSEFLANLMRQNLKKNKEVIVSRNPIFNKTFAYDDFSDKSNVLTNKLCFKFVYFGRFSKEKNLECLITAFKSVLDKNNNTTLTLIGSGEEEVNLKDLCEKLGIHKKVTFFPFMKKDELNILLKSHHVSVLPSKCYETASMVTIESVMNNLIPIVANHGGMKEMVDLIKFGLTFLSEDIFDLTNKMVYSINNYNIIMKDIEDAKFKVKKTFGNESFENTYRDLYI